MLSRIRVSSSSVTSVHPTQPVEILSNVSMQFCSHLLTSLQNFTEIVPGEPLRRRLNASGVAKYSDVGHVKGYILETVQNTAWCPIND